MDFFNMGNDDTKPENGNVNYFDTRSTHDNDSTSLSPQAILARNSISETSNGQNMSNNHISMSPQQMFTPMSSSNISANPVANNNPNSPAVGAATPQQILMFNNNNYQQGYSSQHSPIVQSSNDPARALPVQENSGKAYAERAAMIASLQAKQQQQQQQQQEQQQHQQPQPQYQQAFNYRGGSVLQNLSPELQKKISIELNNKQYELFMKSLIENCKRRNMPLQSIPEIHGKKVNLFILFMLVQRLGGGEQVSRTQRWDLLSQKLQIQDSQQLASVYYRIVLPYEKYLASPEGLKESQAKKIFFQQFFQELIRKIQANSKPENNAFNQALASTPNSSATPTNISSFKQQPTMQQMQQSMQQKPSIAPKPKKPRKPRQKKKTKKELELERRQQEEMLRKQQQAILEQQQKQRLLVEHQLQRQKEMIRQQYQQELAKLPKVYKRGLARNYKPSQRQMNLTSGYDMNYLSQIGEKIEANKPIFLFPPELGTVNLHAVSMSLQSNDLGEVNTALNTLLVASADSVLKVPLDRYPETLDAICILGIKLLRDIFTRNIGSNHSARHADHNDNPSPKNVSLIKVTEEINTGGLGDIAADSYNYKAGYCEEYDVNAFLDDRLTSYSKTNDLINEIFDRYKQHAENMSENDKVIAVDSLTGEDLQQSSIFALTPAQTPKAEEANANSRGDSHRSETQDNSIGWDVLPEPLKDFPGQPFSDLSVPSYLQSLKSINDEIDTVFTKVNTRGAEDKNISITDQISTISMILRNFSFSEKNSKLMAKNTFLKRFYLDLLWMLFLNPNMLIFHRKAFNFKKDTIVTLTNICHAYEINSQLECFLILMLVLSFGEPRKTMPEQDSHVLTYAERPINKGHYSGFSADIFAKLLSLDHPNRRLFKEVLLLFPSEGYGNDGNCQKDIVYHLVNAYCDGDSFRLLNDVVSFLLSLIPFMQADTTPSLIEEKAPVIAQSLTCLLTLINFLDTNEAPVRDIKFENVPLRWLTAEENIGASLRRLSDVLSNIGLRTDRNLLHLRRLLLSISSKAIEVTSLMVEKSLELAGKSDRGIFGVCETLASIPGLLPSECQSYTFSTHSVTDPEISKQNERLYRVRNRVLSHLVKAKSPA
ncbi:hypothetical protein HG536_0H01680 [Torulaspora globosa]|uniref:ARID domain-containing protein n=1 Tax=Torulaspora globosa TaxID=48254 RepID=A0A7G3ZMQ7_9SACH|nr:uncharacterized protein HG536_0H01680 [Torulaspora globosa]QLL34793.1 hypothetical protein HG536_0H01680 [Torulaspora globosa]